MAPSVAVCRSSSLLEQPELEAAVCRALSCDLSAVQSLDLGAQRCGAVSDGFLSTCGSMTVDAVVRGRHHQLHLFVKREDAKDIVSGLDSFRREGLFYDDILPRLESAWRRGSEPASPDLGPAAYLGTDSVVVMEDLTRRGYSAVEDDWMWNGVDYQTVQQTLRAQARLHAASLLAQYRDGVRFAPEVLHENFVTRRPGVVGRRIFDTAADVICKYLLPVAVKSLAVPQTPAELQRLKDLTRDLYAELDVDALRRREKQAGGVLTIGHGDAWPNNVLVKRDAQGRTEHAVLVDFQMVRLAPPALDVVMFVTMSTRRAFRDKHLPGLLREYYDDLAGYCRQRGLDITEELFSFETFMASVERVRGMCRALGAAYTPVLGGDDADMRHLHQDGDQRARFLTDAHVRGPLVARWYAAEGERGDRYRRYVNEYLEEVLGLPPSAA
ncbi:hypothetical protein ONE63_010622 [Megalurothrips usitatus]|uniref:CHK kinase-like domain-containing protein n=1 Tax=Megalurothrips usitatus TaxID=439358 RepID=A0AAV7XHP0_9NEOP|nr:hypothetical protein ONE63_010622 [Megalurothrips usitatus]